MKTITLTEAIETATKGPLELGAMVMAVSGMPTQDKSVILSPSGIMFPTYGDKKTLLTSALLAHWYNIGPELVAMLDNVMGQETCICHELESGKCSACAIADLLTRANSVQIPD